MTPDDRDRRHRWAATCDTLFTLPGLRHDFRNDLREIAAYLRAPLAREDAATKEEERNA